MSRPPLKPCGTNAAYKRHIAHGEKTCDPCKRAHSEYTRNLDSARKTGRIRYAALSILQKRYSSEALALLSTFPPDKGRRLKILEELRRQHIEEFNSIMDGLRHGTTNG